MLTSASLEAKLCLALRHHYTHGLRN